MKTVTKISAAAIAIVAVAAVYAFFDPAGALFPRCMFKTVTGWNCPGCGSQRALHALLTGHPAEAWHFNPYLFIAVPVALFFGFVEAIQTRFPALHRALIRPVTFYILILLTVLWTIARNLL